MEMKMKKGLGRAVYFDDARKEDVLLVENMNENSRETVIIPRSEIGDNKNLQSLVGKLVDYVDADEVGIASMKKAMPVKRKMLLSRFENGEVLSGRVTSIQRWGAFLTINGVSCLIRNCDFASDYSTIADVYREGDIIDGLKLRKVSETDRISLEKVEKYESPHAVDLSNIKSGSVILGTVRNVKPFGCFVAVANGNIDALCPVPQDTEIEEGMKVKCRLTNVDLESDERKVRGKIESIINEIEEE